MNATLHPDVLICGAGPTGLMLALRLVRSGVRVRIIDQAPEPGSSSRALVVHARTLEFYRQMGLADAFLEAGLRFEAINLWVRRRRVARVAFGDIGKGLSYFPFALICAQDRHERFLVEHLGRTGVHIERGLELIGFEQSQRSVRAQLKLPGGGEEACEAAYLAGCDGAHSRVRELLDTGFPGGTYSHWFYVADVEAGGAVNLAWKLADVIQGRAPSTLVDSYEPERIAFARKLVATTDRAFVLATSSGRLARFVRTRIVPALLPMAIRFRRLRRFLFRTVSQTAIHYRACNLNLGAVGPVHGGDRLPWVPPDRPDSPADNFAVLDGLAWQVHVYGVPGPGLAEACEQQGLAFHVLPWRSMMRKVGLTQDALYLVRPDGHVALVATAAIPVPLQQYLQATGLRV